MMKTSWILLSCVLGTACVAPEEETAPASARIIDDGEGGGGGGTGDPDPTPPMKPVGPAFTTVTDRGTEHVTIQWVDSATDELDNVVERQVAGGSWQPVASLGVLSGQQTWRDAGLAPDALYCYRVRADGSGGSSYSPEVCAYTQDDRALWRVRLRVVTANVDGAATDDSVTARLDSSRSDTWPHDNATNIDYGQNDFERTTDPLNERNGDFTYDLVLDGLQRVADITELTIWKPGYDDWCVSSFALEINGRVVYDRAFGTTASTCRWVTYGNPVIAVSHDQLRQDPRWPGLTFPSLQIPRDEIAGRIESIVGNSLGGQSLVHWGSGYQLGPIYDPAGHVLPRKWVDVSRVDDHMLHVALDLGADGPLFFNPSVRIDFDLAISVTTDPLGNQALSIRTINLSANVDFGTLVDILGALPIAALACSIGSGTGVTDCTSWVESMIQDELLRTMTPIAQQIPVSGCRLVSATVNPFADLDLAVQCP
jgi:hypothetical protein